MYKKIRKSVADSIATVDNPEQFQWNRWLREPQIYLERFPKPRIDIKKVESFTKFEETSLFQVKKFALTKFKISEEIKNVVIKKKKTFKIFFSFPKTYEQRITIFSPDTVRMQFLLTFFQKDKEHFVRTKFNGSDTTESLVPQIISKKITTLKITVKKFLDELTKASFTIHDCNLLKPALADFKIEIPPSLSKDKVFNLSVLRPNTKKRYLGIAFNPLDKIPKLKNIPVFNLEELKNELNKTGSKKIVEISLNELDQIPKQYRVKLIDLNKIKVPLYHLKNLHTKQAKLKGTKVEFLERAQVNAKNLVKEYFPEIEISESVIPPQLIPPQAEEPPKKAAKSKTKKEPAAAKSKKLEEAVPVKEVPKVEEAVPVREEPKMENIKQPSTELEQKVEEKTKVEETAKSEEKVELKTDTKTEVKIEPQVEAKKEDKAEIPPVEIKKEIKEVSLEHLSYYQREGVKLLLNNKTALLSDELGIDKKDQVVHALNAAIAQGLIQKALIVCPTSHIGNKQLSEFGINADGWENKILKVNPELRTFTIKETNEEANALIENAQIVITNYNKLIEFSNDPVRENIYGKIECLVFDEAQALLNSQVQPEQLFNFPSAKYHWVLSSLPPQIIEERLIPRLKNHLSGFDKIDGSLSRTKQVLGNELASVARNDYWHDLDFDQAQEFENTLLQGRKRILDLVKGGNPFIIQSNIFTLIHQIKQLGNFSTHKETSPKSELLLDQLESIIASGQKGIIFSQYDKQGIQKIEKLLKNNQIRYVLYQSGMPLKELENSANLFKKDPKVSIMLAGLTAASIKVKIPDSPYLIHFDQWWNPITQWQYEDKSISSDDHNQNSSVNVINYFGNNSVEINIRKTLKEKGLLTKNLIEFLSNETIYSLVTNEDWLDILEIEHTRTIKTQKPDVEKVSKGLLDLSLEEIGQKTKALFSKLGYKNLIMKPDMLHAELSIYGMANKGLQEIKTAIFCLPFKVQDVEPVEAFIKEASKNNARLFVVCSDKILEKLTDDPHEKIIYIGQHMFANYLAQLKIS